ncbi:MAG: hypothetical protein ACJ8C4_12060 [Gemmataceae bacterium]
MIRSAQCDPRRKGIILVVVVALLALFAVVGLGYVMYAESAATSARMSSEGQNVVTEVAKMDPQILMARALGDLIYDCYDDARGVYSSMRGNSLARAMYGWNYQDSDYGTDDFVPEYVTANGPPRTKVISNPNTVPWNGLGKLHYTDPNLAAQTGGQSMDTFDIINFAPLRTDPLVRDPERYPDDPTQPTGRSNNQTSIMQPSNLRYFGGWNVPYTYPDNHNVYLGAVRAADGQVIMPSFHRPYLFKMSGLGVAPVNNVDPTDPNFLAEGLKQAGISHKDWYRPSGRLKLIRPRPIDNLTPDLVAQLQAAGLPYPPPEQLTDSQITLSNPNSYPAMIQKFINAGKLMPCPSDVGGDVKNLLGSPGGNDSIWMDLGYPVQVTSGGKKYKPLFAYLVVDMDGRINLNATGNMRALDTTNYNQYSQLHASNQGIGRSEINASHILNVEEYLNDPNVRAQYGIGGPIAPVVGQLPEWTNLFLGAPTGAATPTVAGRYQPGQTSVPGELPPVIAQPFADGSPNGLDTTYGKPYPNGYSSFYNPAYYLIDTDGCYGPNNNLPNPNRAVALGYAGATVSEPLTLSSFPAFADPSQLDTAHKPTGTYSVAANYVHTLNGVPDAGNGFGGDSLAERTSHPLLYNPLRASNGTQTLDAQDMHKIIGRYDSPLDFGDSTLAQLLPKNFARSPSDFGNNTAQYNAAVANANRLRHMITLLSADLGRPALTPSVLDPAQTSTTPGSSTYYSRSKFDPAAPYVPGGPGGPPAFVSAQANFPISLQGQEFAPLNTLISNIRTGAGKSPVVGNTDNDFAGNAYTMFDAPVAGSAGATAGLNDNPPKALSYDGRSRIAAMLGRIDLNRPLRPYPNLVLSNGKYYNTTAGTYAQQLKDANDDRQAFAADIFRVLRLAVGAPHIPELGEPAATTPLTSAQYYQLQWLAQLAANIVDYIDEDDVMTKFVWINANGTTQINLAGTTGTFKPGDSAAALTNYVFGVEMPKVVLNEAYMEVTNGNRSTASQPTQPTNPPATSPTKYLWQQTDGSGNPVGQKKALKYQVNIWAELHNTMVPPVVNNGNPTYQDFSNRCTEWLKNGSTGYSAYRLKVLRPKVSDYTASKIKPQTIPTIDTTATAATDVDFTGPSVVPQILPVDTTNTAGGTMSFRTNLTGSKNAGFYVVAPKWVAGTNAPTDPGGDPQAFADTGTYQHAAMTYDVYANDSTYKDFKQVPAATPSDSKGAPSGTPSDGSNSTAGTPPVGGFQNSFYIPPANLVLQRLADPYRPFAADNPYITVDVMEFPYEPYKVNGQTELAFTTYNATSTSLKSQPIVNPKIAFHTAGAISGTMPPRMAVGRRQPFAGSGDQTDVRQLVPSPATVAATQVAHTLYAHNASTGGGTSPTPPATLPEAMPNGLDRFDWFVHPDRKLVSPMELVHVSAVAPWDVTRKFITYNPDSINADRPHATASSPYNCTDNNIAHRVLRQGHTAPWFDEWSAYTMNSTTPYGAAAKVPIIANPAAITGLTNPTLSSTAAPSTRLYRALEFFRTGDRTIEMAFGGRDIGKVNINTIWDKEVFDAVMDAVRVNNYDSRYGFTQADVQALWTTMNCGYLAGSDANNRSYARTPNYYFNPPLALGSPPPLAAGSYGTYSNPIYQSNPYATITADDRPFWSLGAPHEDITNPPPGETRVQYQYGFGIDNTLLRKIVPPKTSPADTQAFKRGRMFDAESQFNFNNPPGTNPQPPMQHPMLEKAMLTKAFEHLTTRSNVFAVYLTVGYFEVVDDSQKPELLGNEIGVILDANTGAVVENKAIRQRMFAIIDRTNLALQPAYCSTINDVPTIVGEDQLKQGPAPFFYTSTATPNAAGPSPTSWFVTVPAETVTKSGSTITSATSHYNGATWTLKPYVRTGALAQDGTVVYVGTGNSTNVVTSGTTYSESTPHRMVVKSITISGAAPNLTATVELGVPDATGAWISPGIPPASPVTISNAIPGNPGPQPDFDPLNPRYQGVVVYSTVLQ